MKGCFANGLLSTTYHCISTSNVGCNLVNNMYHLCEKMAIVITCSTLRTGSFNFWNNILYVFGQIPTKFQMAAWPCCNNSRKLTKNGERLILSRYSLFCLFICYSETKLKYKKLSFPGLRSSGILRFVVFLSVNEVSGPPIPPIFKDCSGSLTFHL